MIDFQGIALSSLWGSNICIFAFHFKVFRIWWSYKEEDLNKQCSKPIFATAAAGYDFTPAAGLWSTGAAQGK
jgi:hypothetical protein